MTVDDVNSPSAYQRLEPADVTSDKTVVVIEEKLPQDDGALSRAAGEPVQDEPDRVTIQSVDRALAILEFVGQSARPQRLQDIAATIGLKVPTCYHLLNSLVTRGFVVRNNQPRTYYLGPRIGELARISGAHLDVRREAMPHLNALAQAACKTVCLATLSGTNLSVVSDVEASGGVPLTGYREAIGNAAHATALGKAILAWLPEPQIARVVADHELTPFTPKTIGNLGDLVEALRQVRRHGFAIEDGEYRAQVSGVAIALRNQAGAVMGAVGCIMPTDQADVHRLRETQLLVQATAKAISSLYR